MENSMEKQNVLIMYFTYTLTYLLVQPITFNVAVSVAVMYVYCVNVLPYKGR